MKTAWRSFCFLCLLAPAKAGLWDNATEVGNGWSHSDWIGVFHGQDSGSGWIYQQDLGWLYAEGVDESSVWFYWPGQGWFWSGKNVFPFVWNGQHSAWLYYYAPTGSSSQASPWFYNFTTSGWASGIVFRPDALNGETLVIETSTSAGHVEASYTFGESTYTAALKRSQLGMNIPIEISGTYTYQVDPNDPETLVCNLTIDYYKITVATLSGFAAVEGTAEEVAAATSMPVTTSATVVLTAAGPRVGTYNVSWTYTNGLSDGESGNLSW